MDVIARERGDVIVGDNERFMSQERSKTSVIAASLFLSLLAYGVGLLAMGYIQGALIRTFQLRLLLIISEIALALPALVVAALLANHIPQLFRFSPLSAGAALRTVVLGLAFWGLSLGVFEAQYVLVKPPLEYLQQFQGLHETLRPHRALGWVFSIAAIAVAPAVCEEILFRGLLTPVFQRAMGSTLAIVLSAALFGAIHVDGLRDGTSVYYRVPFAFILGMLLARLRIDTGSLWPPMIAHATLNATTFLVVIFIEEPKGTLPDPQPLAALAMLLVGSTVAMALMKTLRTPAQAPIA
ncbi:MAG TPA: type II CAAX endopeptidase family protein [Vicinamibacteria bacterium]|nr:type II CAAX endopeptidase family protein [Vicinamibacteria bacterium]